MRAPQTRDGVEALGEKAPERLRRYRAHLEEVLETAGDHVAFHDFLELAHRDAKPLEHIRRSAIERHLDEGENRKPQPLRIYMEMGPRTAPHLGMVKTGGNYAAALGPTLQARRAHKADQVLFCPDGQVQETGAANFLLLREGEIVTRGLDSTFLHGVTRDSLLTLARDQGYAVSERIIDVEETLRWIGTGEAALSGTAAVLAGVGTLIHAGREHRVGTGEVGPVTQALRQALIAIQRGDTPDKFGWLTPV